MARFVMFQGVTGWVAGFQMAGSSDLFAEYQMIAIGPPHRVFRYLPQHYHRLASTDAREYHVHKRFAISARSTTRGSRQGCPLRSQPSVAASLGQILQVVRGVDQSSPPTLSCHPYPTSQYKALVPSSLQPSTCCQRLLVDNSAE